MSHDHRSVSRASVYTGFTAHTTHTTQTLASFQSSQGYRKETFGDRIQQLKDWVYDWEVGLVMGRTPSDWSKLSLMCFIHFWIVMIPLTGFSALLWKSMDWNVPNLKGADTILQTPGLSFRPQPFPQMTLVRFFRGWSNTYAIYLDHLEAYVQYYERDLQLGDFYMDCSSITGRRKELDKACVFDMNIQLGSSCVKQINYGYDDAQPCFMLKLNKIYDWIPEEYQSIDEVPDAIKNVWDPSDPFWIHVACEADDPVSKDLMGPIVITPTKGFAFKYFPFRNQQGYRSPLVSIQFTAPTLHVLFMVTCKAYARNIIHEHNTMVGEAHFELMID